MSHTYHVLGCLQLPFLRALEFAQRKERERERERARPLSVTFAEVHEIMSPNADDAATAQGHTRRTGSGAKRDERGAKVP